MLGIFIVYGQIVLGLNVMLPVEVTRGIKCVGQWQAAAVFNVTDGPGTVTFSDAVGPIGSVTLEREGKFIGCVNKGVTFTWKVGV
jgi:hypothetical protein